MTDPNVTTGPYPERHIRVGVAIDGDLVLDATLEAGTDVSVGPDDGAGLVVRGWQGPRVLVVSQGRLLHLAPGMRLHMCDEAGQHRVKGTCEELQSQGFSFPLPVPVSRLNITVKKGVSVFIHFAEQPAQPGLDVGPPT